MYIDQDARRAYTKGVDDHRSDVPYEDDPYMRDEKIQHDTMMADFWRQGWNDSANGCVKQEDLGLLPHSEFDRHMRGN